MALQGTIKDFALPDIFQLIGIQRKTGVLTLLNDHDSVTIKFLEGQVVGADTRSESLEDRLGTLLVRTGRITQAQRKEALKIQKNTLQRLGYILVSSGFISEDELIDALKVQSSQIIYRLFRWRAGEYHFDAVEDLEYDQKHFMPISSETILMEGARMIDEWPIIERRIRSDKMVLRKTAAAESLEVKVESILEDDIDFSLGFECDHAEIPAVEEQPPGGGVTISPEEREVIALVDGKRTVGEICDLLCIGEFDTYRLLSELFTRNLIEENRSVDVIREASPRSLTVRALQWAVSGALVGLALWGLLGLGQSRLAPWRLVQDAATADRLKTYASLARMERIETAIQIFYLDAGTFPAGLLVLSENGYLDEIDLDDPWGRPYGFQISGGGYRLAGADADGHPRPELTYSRQFSSVEQMMTNARNPAP